MNNQSRSSSGQAMVELALVLPILCIIVLGIVEFGVIFYDKAMITNASREGARAGIVFQGDTDGTYIPHTLTEITAVVDNYLNGKLIRFGGSSAPQTSLTINESLSPGGKVGVRVSYAHAFLVFPRMLGWNNTITIGSETIMRTE